jgi:hypothetical protein
MSLTTQRNPIADEISLGCFCRGKVLGVVGIFCPTHSIPAGLERSVRLATTRMFGTPQGSPYDDPAAIVLNFFDHGRFLRFSNLFVEHSKTNLVSRRPVMSQVAAEFPIVWQYCKVRARRVAFRE